MSKVCVLSFSLKQKQWKRFQNNNIIFGFYFGAQWASKPFSRLFALAAPSAGQNVKLRWQEEDVCGGVGFTCIEMVVSCKLRLFICCKTWTYCPFFFYSCLPQIKSDTIPYLFVYPWVIFNEVKYSFFMYKIFQTNRIEHNDVQPTLEQIPQNIYI